MLNSIHVQFEDSKFNYWTSVNALAKFDELKRYFVGNTFFMGSCEEHENDDYYWQTVVGIELKRTKYKVVSGSFKGEVGFITGKMLNDLYLLQVESGDKLSVTSSQIEEIKG